MDLTDYGKPKHSRLRKDLAPPPAQTRALVPSPELTGNALRLLVILNTHVALTELPTNFPRVLNRIADVWNRPAFADQLFDELMLDARGARQGFSLAVIGELIRLRDYHLKRYPKNIDPWEQTHLR